jgi:hypothetical protein
VVGATPAYLRSYGLPENGIFRTDIEFGSGYRSPLIIIGKLLKKVIQEQNISGIYFLDAYGSED